MAGPAISVVMDKEACEKAGIVSAPLRRISRARQSEAYGRVLSLKGLADLRRSYVLAVARVENAKAKLRVSKVEYKRLKSLYSQNQSSSLKNLQLAESLRSQDQVNLETARTRRRLLAGTALQQWGKVIADRLSTGDRFYWRLMERRDLLLLVSLPPGEDISPMPREVTIQPPGKARLAARYVSASPRTDPQIQGLSYFYTVSTKSGQLRTGMNLAVFVPKGQPVDGFLIYSRAVVWQNGQPLVFVQSGEGRFTARPVATNMPVKAGYLVRAGFSASDRVVVTGAQALLSEAHFSVPRKAAGGGGDGDDD